MVFWFVCVSPFTLSPFIGLVLSVNGSECLCLQQEVCREQTRLFIRIRSGRKSGNMVKRDRRSSAGPSGGSQETTGAPRRLDQCP